MNKDLIEKISVVRVDNEQDDELTIWVFDVHLTRKAAELIYQKVKKSRAEANLPTSKEYFLLNFVSMPSVPMYSK